MHLLRRFRTYLSAPVDGASLALFRICLGLAVSYSMFKYLVPGSTTFKVWFVDPEWTFPYLGFEWIAPLSPALLKLSFFVTGVAALSFAAGVFYRISAIISFVGYTYYFLIDSSLFNNHFYLISLLTFLCIWLPSDRRFALRLPRAPRKPPSPSIPRWPVFLLRSQLFLVYFYGGIAKINADWLTGEPIIGSARIFADMLSSIFPFLEPVEAIVYARIMAWIGLILDLSIGFLLLIPRSRLFAIGLLAVFHGINHFTLPIGVFPFLGFTASFIFLEPDWPLRFWAWIRKPRFVRPDKGWAGWGSVLIPGIGALLGWKLPRAKPVSASLDVRPGRFMIGFVTIWLALQVLVPLRHFFISGDPSWTEEGQYFSWRMMLRQKAAGNLVIHLDDPGIYQPRSQGRRIDWRKVPDAASRAIFVSVDASGFDWAQNRGLNTIYEGLIGFRMLQVVEGTTEEEVAAERAALESWWKEHTDREFVVRETLPLEACLQRSFNRFGKLYLDDKSERFKRVAKILEIAQLEVAELNRLTPRDGPRQFAGIHDYLISILESDYGDVVREELVLAHPFSLLGVEPPADQRFWLIAHRSNAAEIQALSDDLDRGDNYLVWCDFGRLRFYEWEGLPEWFPVFESGRLPVMWNYFRELNIRQTKQLAVRPFMIRQYARRIAGIWEERYGRRPSVHGYGTVMMNYRHPRPIVDSTVDLASVDYRFTRHNEWILPLDSERIGITRLLEKSKE